MDISSSRITGISSIVDSGDAVNKEYVDFRSVPSLIGNEGEVLSVSGGNLSWEPLSSSTEYTTPGTHYFQVPSSAKEFYIQATGAGGAGESGSLSAGSIELGKYWTKRTIGNTNLQVLISSNTVDGKLYVAGGSSSQLSTSTDAIVWTQRTTGVSGIHSVRRIVKKDGNEYLISTTSGSSTTGGNISKSTDAIHWQSIISNVPYMYALDYLNGLYIASGELGFTITSTDSIVWQLRTTTGQYCSRFGLAYGNGNYIIVGFNAQGTIARSTDTIHWENTSVDLDSLDLNAAIFAKGSFLIGGSDGTLFASTDAFTWTARSSINGQDFNKLHYDSDIDVYFGVGYYNIVGSTDTIVWYDVAESFRQFSTYYDIISDSDYFFIQGTSRNYYISPKNPYGYSGASGGSGAHSAFTIGRDKITGSTITVNVGQGGTGGKLLDANAEWQWEIRTSGLTFDSSEGVYAQGYYLISDRYSTDTVVWQQTVGQVGTGAQSTQYYKNGLFFSINFGALSVSTDIITWTARTTGADIKGSSFIYQDGNYLYAGVDSGNNSGRLLHSTDTVHWFARTQTFLRPDNILYLRGSKTHQPLYILESSGNYAYSTDSIVWVQSAESNLSNIRYDERTNTIWSVNNSGTYISTDGLSWELNANNFSQSGNLLSNVYGDGTYFINQLVDRTFNTSTDRLNWTKRTYAGDVGGTYGYGTVYGDNKWVILQTGGKTIVSTRVQKPTDTTASSVSWDGPNSRTYTVSANSGGSANNVEPGAGASASTDLNTVENTNGLDGVEGNILDDIGKSGTDQTLDFQPTPGGGGSYNNGKGGTSGNLIGLFSSSDGGVASGLYDGLTPEEYASQYGPGGGGGAAPNKPGEYWLQQVTPASRNINKLASGGGFYLTGGDGGELMVSTDVVVWSLRTTGVSDITGLKYANGFYFISYGTTNTGTLAVSTDTVVWIARTTGLTVGGAATGAESVIYQDGLYIFAFDNDIAVSTDTIHWTSRTTGLSSGDIEDIGYNSKDNLYWAHDLGSQFLYSTDTIAWEIVNQGNTYLGIDYNTDDGLYVAVGSGGLVGVSTDGLSWQLRTIGNTNTYYAAAYSEGVYVIVGQGGQLRTSTDTISWKEVIEDPSNFDQYNDVYAGDGFFMIGDENNDLIVSVATIGRVGNGGNGYRGGGGGSGGYYNIPEVIEKGLSTWTIQTSNSNQTQALTTIDPYSYTIRALTNWSLRTSGVTTTIKSSSGRKNISASAYALVLGTDVLHSTDRIHWTLRTSQGSYNSSRHPAESNNTSSINADAVVFNSNQFGGDAPVWTLRTSGTIFTTYVNNIDFGNGIYVAVRNPQDIITSTDIIHWTSNGAPYIGDIKFVNGIFFNPNSNGNNLRTSIDGTTWISRTTGTSSSVTTPVYANNIYVVVGENGEVRTSTDTIVWEGKDSGTINELGSITFGNGLFVAGGVSGGASKTLITSTDATVWSTRSTDIAISGLTFKNNLYLAIGSGVVARLRSSTDAIVWTARTLGISASLYGLDSSNYYFIVSGSNGLISLSTDGTAWVQRTSNTSETLFSASHLSSNTYVTTGTGTIITSPDYTYGVVPEQHIAVGTVGKIDTSTDSVMWELRTSGVIDDLNAVELSSVVETGFFRAPQYETVIEAGTSWILRTGVHNSKDYDSVAYQDNLFLAGADQSTLVVSTDSIVWTARTVGGNYGYIQSMAYNGSVHLIGTTGSPNLLSSTDTVVWTTETLAIGQEIRALIYDVDDNLFFASGQNVSGTPIQVSTDGTQWTLRTSGFSGQIYEIVSAPIEDGIQERYLTVGGNGGSGTARSSTDGVVWTDRPLTNGRGWAAAYGNGIYLVGQENKNIIASTDNIVWQVRTSPLTIFGTVKGINYISGYFYISSYGSYLYQSTDTVVWNQVSTIERHSESMATDGDIVVGAGPSFLSASQTYDRLGYFPQEPYVAVGDKGKLLSSTDEVHWTSKTVFENQSFYDLKSVSWSSTRQEFLVGGGYGITPVGDSWTVRTAETPNYTFIGIAYGNSIYAGIGNGDTDDLETSTDGTTWVSRLPGLTASPRHINSDGTNFLIVGDNPSNTSGMISYSTDTIAWTLRTSGINATMWQCVSDGSEWVIAGGSGNVLHSTDTISWSTRVHPLTGDLRKIGYGGGYYLIGNSLGNIMVSTDSVQWDTVNTGTSGFTGFVGYENGYYFASHYAVPLIVSTNTVVWSRRTLQPSFESNVNYTQSLAYISGRYFAADDSGSVAVSTDTIVWELAARVSYSDGYLADNDSDTIVHGSSSGFIQSSTNLYNDSVLMASSDAVNWSVRTTTIDSDYINGIDYSGGGSYVAVGGGYLEGTLWTVRTGSGTGASFNSLAYGNGIYFGQDIGFVTLASTDSVVWQRRTAGEPDGNYKITSAAYANGLYLAAVDARSPIVSTDSVVWITRTSGLPDGTGDNDNGTINNIIYVDGQYIVVGNHVSVSTDTVSWVIRTKNTTTDYNTIAYGNGVYVVNHGGSLAPIVTSTDTIVWVARTSGGNFSGGFGGQMVFFNNQFVIPTGFGYILNSTDGVVWDNTLPFGFNSGNFDDTAYNDGYLVSVGNKDGNSHISISTDGNNWSLRTSNTASLNEITFGDNIFLAVGGAETIITSPVSETKGSISQSTDTVHWTARTGAIDTRLNLTSASYKNNSGQFAATAATTPDSIAIEPSVNPLGTSKTNLMTSTDGIMWEPRFTRSSSNLYSVFNTSYGSTLDLSVNAVGDGGTIISASQYDFGSNVPGLILAGNVIRASTDAIVWELRTSRSIFTEHSLIHVKDTSITDTSINNNKIYAADGSFILTSTDTISWYYNTIPIGGPKQLAYSEHNENRFILNAFKSGGGGYIYGATDGVHWQLRTSDIGESTKNITSVGASNQYFLASNYTDEFQVSTDTIVWTEVTVPSIGSSLDFVTKFDYLNNYYFANTRTGTTSVSTDTVVWQIRTLFVGNINSLLYSNTRELYAIAFNNGYIAVSTDTVVWNNNVETETSNKTYDLNVIESFYSPTLGNIFVGGGFGSSPVLVTSSTYDALISPENEDAGGDGGDGGDGYVKISWW